MKLETTTEEQYVAELIKDRGHYPKLARRMFDERNTLLARNEELEQALRERSIQLHTVYRINGMEGDRLVHDSRWQNCTDEIFCIPDRTLINGEEKL